MLCTANYKLINLQIKNMKSGKAIVFIAVLLIGIFSCKKEDDRVEITDERLFKEWQLDSMKVNNNILTKQIVNEETMLINGQCIVSFSNQQNFVTVDCGSLGIGKFKVFEDNFIKIDNLIRGDDGGFESSPWFLMIKENLNNSHTYKFREELLIIKTKN